MPNQKGLTQAEMQKIEEDILPQILQGVFGIVNMLDLTCDIFEVRNIHQKVAKHVKLSIDALMKEGLTKEQAIQFLIPSNPFQVGMNK